ncbi:MAG TPA: hypothetical protein VER12_15835 [Polyangiaceae bacterium]|nr:hypothetical protein [Polyangiaceae bacterium]HYQ27357.1 hypothetical protein [Polyangiaceae bacterium]
MTRVSFVACLALLASKAHAQEPPAQPAPKPRVMSPVAAVGVWAAAQLIPSPLLVMSKQHVGGGMRWQLTPLLYSFGIAERPVRTFLVSPIVRHSGSVELHVSPEWACCVTGEQSSWLVRAGVRLYLPLLEHGEKLSWSLGGSYYRAAGGGGAAADLGIFTFAGALGLNLTVSPWLTRREVILALTIRLF